jgi:predicted RND superfamily exporter protein
MNRRKLFFVLSIFSVIAVTDVQAQTLTVEKAREQFFTQDKTVDGALKLYNSLEKAELGKNPVLLAYRGASSAAAAGSVNGVRKKLEYFNRGKAELEKAVGLKPLDAEIRFLRLATQVNAPGFLGYNSEIENDKSLIIKTLQSVAANHPNSYLYHRICNFMLTHAELKTSEKAVLDQLIKKFNSK